MTSTITWTGSEARRRRFVRDIEDHAARYAGPHCTIPDMGVSDAARYVIGGHIDPWASVTRDEWDWVVDYIRTHPYVLTDRPAKFLDEVEADRKTEAGAAAGQALEAFCADRYAEALELAEWGAWLSPGAQNWTRILNRIRGAMNETGS
jgi:hypothetical protein